MATNIWLKISSTPRPTIGASFSATKRPIIPKSVTPRASLSEFPLASKIMVRKQLKLRLTYLDSIYTPTLYNLSYSTNESCLKKEFSKFGEIAEVKLVKDEATNKSKGCAFIQYTNQDEAMEALESMDEKNFDGRVIYVDLAKPSKNFSRNYPKTCGPPEEYAEPHY